LLGAFSFKVGAACHFCNLAEGRLIQHDKAPESPTDAASAAISEAARKPTAAAEQIAAQLLAGAGHGSGVRGAEADGVDAHLAIYRLLGSVHWVWTTAVGAVGEQNDDVGLVCYRGLLGPEVSLRPSVLVQPGA